MEMIVNKIQKLMNIANNPLLSVLAVFALICTAISIWIINEISLIDYDYKEGSYTHNLLIAVRNLMLYICIFVSWMAVAVCLIYFTIYTIIFIIVFSILGFALYKTFHDF